jgi:hypothetical protein
VNLLAKTINYAGFEYRVVGEFPEISWAYRDIEGGEIEILTFYCSEPVVSVVHLEVMKRIIADMEAQA